MTPEVALGANRQLDDGRSRLKAVADHLDTVRSKSAPDAVHLVDEAKAGHVVLVRLAPDGLGLGLDARHGVEDGHGPVEHAKRALDLDGEVDVAGVSMMLIQGVPPDGRSWRPR